VNSGSVIPQTDKILALLTLDRFPFRVAIYPGFVPELGEVLEVHAFDLPEAGALDVSRRLNRLLSSQHSKPLAVGTVFLDHETGHCAARVPGDAIWFAPESALSLAKRRTDS